MRRLLITTLPLIFALTGCSPEVGSKQWCQNMEEKPKGDWTANELKDYTKSCLFGGSDEN